LVSGGGNTSFASEVESVEFNGIVITTTTTPQPYLPVGGPSFIVKGHIQMRIHPQQDIALLKTPVCKGISYSTGQPPQACMITGYETEHNEAGEEEINFAFNLTILNSDYGQVSKKIDHYVPDKITNVVRWECQHDNISPEAHAGTMVVHVVEYSCAYVEGKHAGGFIGLLGELVVDIGEETSKEIVGDFDNDTDDGDSVTKRYVRHAFSDSLMAATRNALDSSRMIAKLSKASGNTVNFTFMYLNQEDKIDGDVSAVGHMNKTTFDDELIELVNQFMDADMQISGVAIKSGYVKKISAGDAQLDAEVEDSSPPPCFDHGGDEDGQEEEVCGVFMMDSNIAEDIQNDQRMQSALHDAFATYTCGDPEEMSMSIELTEDAHSSALPTVDQVTLAERSSRSVAKTKTKARLRSSPDGHEPHTNGQTDQEMKVDVCTFAKSSRIKRVHFMMKHLPWDGTAELIIGLAKKIGEDEGIFSDDEHVNLVIKHGNVSHPEVTR
jgi:hypothetical protein